MSLTISILNYCHSFLALQQIFIFNTLTLCTIGLIHIETGKKYIVVFTDNNKIRDYKNGVIEELYEKHGKEINFF